MKRYEIYAFKLWWPLAIVENLDGQRLFVPECPFAAFPVRGLRARLAYGDVREVPTGEVSI